MTNHSQGADAPSRALAMPELLSLVCSFLEKKDCAICLSISRHTFASFAPIVWEAVDLKSVLLLIPEMQVTRDETCQEREPHLFPDTIDLARFEVYRYFVKVVSTTTPYAINFPEEWSGAGGQVPSRPLLPNLRSITINAFGWVNDSYTDWAPRFLTPDLKEFKMCSIRLKESSGEDVGAHKHAWINPSRCLELIDEISQICPAIETLEIFAHEEGDEENRTIYGAICQKVASLHNLRSLSFGGTSAGETLFQALASLSRLQNLSLVSDYSQTPPQENFPVALSDDSFSALQRLTLLGLSPNIVARVYDSPQLFRRLASAKVTYEALHYDGSESDDLRSFYAMKCFSHGCSRLTDLTILTEENIGHFSLFRRFIPIFKQLPLRRLRLCGVVLNPELNYSYSSEDRLEEAGLENNDPEVTWEEFLAALPLVEELHMINSFDVQDLVIFADSLVKLRYFAPCSIEARRITDMSGHVAARPTAIQPIVICCDYPQYRNGGNYSKDALNMAR
ncbi:hypothetical protein FRC09_006240 [Ceratobasidium sp. 395]|nr:hypothetical protein FRC09_006240 [Ceratobasidium sp. 395]